MASTEQTSLPNDCIPSPSVSGCKEQNAESEFVSISSPSPSVSSSSCKLTSEGDGAAQVESNSQQNGLELQSSDSSHSKDTDMIMDTSSECLAGNQNEDDEEKTLKETELGKYWATVQENPMDFTGWTYLLQYVEQENNQDNCRKAFEAFFSHYPYCYGYWKKYSDVERKHGNKDRAKEVFEKGLKAIPLSVELWLHYIQFYIAEYETGPGLKDNIRRLYERALAAAGLEFRSDKLWDSYVAWEVSNENLKAVTSIYERLIKTPTQMYSHHWDNYKKHINSNHPKDFLDVDTFLKLRSESLNKSFNYQADDDQDVELDEVLPPGESTDLDAPPGVISSLCDENELKKIRAKLIEIKEDVFKANEAEVSKRWTFEENIRRPYFHFKPLERGQLKNWRDYLDFEVAQGDHKRIVVLFERSMIACALYEDFWMKYAKYLEQHSIDGVRNVYQRACEIHLPKKPYIHLAWAAFEERKGNYTLARNILMTIEKNVPGLAMVSMRRVSLERRSQHNQAAELLLKTYTESAASHRTKTFFAIKYARFLQKVLGDTGRARVVLNHILEADNSNEKVFLQLLDLEYQCQPVEEERVMAVFSHLLKSDVSLDFKIKVSQRRMEFLEDFGTCIQKITEAYDEHQKLLKIKEVDSKKKLRPDKEHSLEEPAEKRSKVDSTPQTAPVSDHNTSLSMPLLAPTPQPEAMYGYVPPWPDASYSSAVTNPYPGYPYPAYPTQYSYY